MNNPVSMYNRRNGAIVDMYNIVVINDTVNAICFDYGKYKGSGRGWDIVEITDLLPYDCPVNRKEMFSKSDRSRIKSRLILETATWKTTDGTLFNNEELEEAIEHERILEEIEKERR